MSASALSLSRPVVGSSRNSTRASVTRPMPTLTRRRSPPLMPLTAPSMSRPMRVCLQCCRSCARPPAARARSPCAGLSTARAGRVLLGCVCCLAGDNAHGRMNGLGELVTHSQHQRAAARTTSNRHGLSCAMLQRARLRAPQAAQPQRARRLLGPARSRAPAPSGSPPRAASSRGAASAAAASAARSSRWPPSPARRGRPASAAPAGTPGACPLPCVASMLPRRA